MSGAGELIYISGNDPSRGIGGHSSYVRMFGRAAIRAGYQPRVICVGEEDAEVPTDFGIVHRVRSPWKPYRLILLPLHISRLIGAVESRLEGRPGRHLIHGFGAWSYAGAVAAERLRKKDVETTFLASSYDTLLNEMPGKRAGVERAHGVRERISWEIEYRWKKYVLDYYERHGYVSAKAVLVNYESVRQILVSSYGAAVASQIRITPYTTGCAFDGSLDRPLPELPAEIAALKDSDAPLLVSVSRHDTRKGLNFFLHALGLLHKRGVRFRACLVGGGPLLAAHRKLANDLGLAGMVAIPGFATDRFAYLRRADAFVLPSLEEGSGSLSMLEAMQAGVAVVASEVDGIPEDVTDGSDALLVPPGDAEALAGALGKVIADTALRTRLAAAGRETFQKRFSPERFSAALGEIYAEMLPGAGKPSSE